MYTAVLKFRIFPCSFFTWEWPLYIFFFVNYRITRKEAWTLRVFLLGLSFPGSPIILETFFFFFFFPMLSCFFTKDFVVLIVFAGFVPACSLLIVLTFLVPSSCQFQNDAAMPRFWWFCFCFFFLKDIYDIVVTGFSVWGPFWLSIPFH